MLPAASPTKYRKSLSFANEADAFQIYITKIQSEVIREIRLLDGNDVLEDAHGGVARAQALDAL